MKTTCVLMSLVFIQACSTQNIVSLSTDASLNEYNPQTTENVDAKRYQADKQLCYKQVQDQSELKMSERYNVTKFRECLVQKGYILLS